MKQKILAPNEAETLVEILKQRFEKNMQRHEGVKWAEVAEKLKQDPAKLWTLNEMENTGGEPDVVTLYIDKQTFVDCAIESPKGRRSLCYDRKALDARKENKPIGNAVEMAENMGVVLLSESEYRTLQSLGRFDEKTSSWIKTPDEIRKLDGAIFADFRYERVFVYHNGAQSYYAARGFRALLHI
ncbi:DUF4256 domain-containing protein [Pedobacter sandarakinus]|uniref:DUF4256 domain-containing protein n=1 Tax=Pedobacter sandarakinus TaxID=353156 RepID=UPI002246F154|nr:DUF4256 domain-containing protein [Pedobacter sandarakinus]MCX2576024.1 DUF4256 domain-containing protein [Pedobacter sandarakinus]